VGLSRMLAVKLIKTRFVRRAVRENADLEIFRQKPTPRFIAGLVLIGASYVFCWPVISALGVFAAYMRQPLWVVAGAPLVWTTTHFLCMFGAYLAGKEHSRAFLKWALRLFVEKHAPDCLPDKIC